MTGLAESLTALFALSIPLLGIGSITGIMALLIYLDHKKKMTMIERGLVSDEHRPERPENRLGWGIVILGIGISLIIGWTFNLDGNVIAGLGLASIGTGLVISYLGIYKIKNQPK